jgi:hypothetical protein
LFAGGLVELRRQKQREGRALAPFPGEFVQIIDDHQQCRRQRQRDGDGGHRHQRGEGRADEPVQGIGAARRWF